MISFANPGWLWGLLGLIIPIAIHLLSRKEGKTIYIGSIRHLTDSDTAQFSSIRLNEILLLILRFLLITLLVFILAGFSISAGTSKNRKWIVVEKGIEKDPRYNNLIDTLKHNGFEFHWLADEFPLLEDSTSATSTNYYRLLEQLNTRELDSAVVLSFSFAKHFRGNSLFLPANLQWVSVEPRENTSVINTIRLTGDSVVARIVKSRPNGTQLEYSRITRAQLSTLQQPDSIPLLDPDTIKISIVADKGFEYDRKIIQATLQAIENSIPVKFKIKSTDNAAAIQGDADFVFWISNSICTIDKKKIIGYTKCINSNLPLLIKNDQAVKYCPGISSLDWIITQRLTEENVLAENFSFKIAQLLTRGFSTRKAADQFDNRSLSDQTVFTEHSRDQDSPKSDKPTTATTEPLLFMLLLLLLITERFVAFKRNQ